MKGYIAYGANSSQFEGGIMISTTGKMASHDKNSSVVFDKHRRESTTLRASGNTMLVAIHGSCSGENCTCSSAISMICNEESSTTDRAQLLACFQAISAPFLIAIGRGLHVTVMSTNVGDCARIEELPQGCYTIR